MGIKKETKKRICAVAALVGSVSAGGALVACGSEEKPVEKAGAEAGVYYFDAGGEEYTMALGDGKHVTLMMGAEKKEGTYGIKDGEIEIKFGKDDVARGAVKETEIALKYGGLDMRFYKKVYYEVRYDSVDGSEIGSVRVLNGKHAEKPADPVKENSMFLGWYVDEEYTMPYIFSAEGVSGDITLYAQWAELVPGAQEYVVRFDLNYETDEKIGNKQTIGGKLYDLPKPGGREGYEFKGWWISAYEDGERLTSEVTKESRIEENRTLYAVWEEKGNGNRLKTPLVSTEGKTVQWNRVEGASSYTVEVENTAGEKRVYQGLTATRQELELTEAGDYKITVTAVKSGNSGENSRGGESWYRYKALARVSMFSVSETSSLVYNGVENAERYYIKVECGNASHKHDRYDNGTSTYYNFANCTMQEGGIKFTVTAEAEGWASSTSVTYVYNRILDGVKEVAYEKETQSIRWASVKNATGYIVEVNGEREEITGTVYSVKGYDPGELKIKVTPKTKGYNSPKGTEITVRKEELAAPKGLELTGTELSWDAVKGAEGYTVKIGEKTYETDRNVYDITEAIAEEPSASGEYRISVKANGEKGSEYSDEIRVRAQTLRGTLKYGDGKVRWGSVIGATEYRVRVNGGAEKTITGGTESEVTLTRRGINEIEVMYAAGETESAWEKLEVTGYAVEFDSRGGTAVDTVYLATGDRLVLPSAPEQIGRVFDGWYDSVGGASGNGYKIENGERFDTAGDKKLYASWDYMEYELVYDYGSGGQGAAGSSGKGTVKIEHNYTLEVPSNSDGRKLFLGWYSTASGAGLRYTDHNGRSYSPWAYPMGGTVYARWANGFAFTYLENSDSYSVVRGDNLISSGLSEITVPTYYDDGVHGRKKVTVIDGYAFDKCSNLVTVNIPDSIKIIAVDSSAFGSCTKLQNINIYKTEGTVGAVYSSYRGALIENNERTGARELKFVPMGKTGTFTVPGTVDTVAAGAFSKSALTEVIVPTGVRNVHARAFADCEALEKVTFTPVLEGEISIEELVINAEAFYRCTNLTEVVFPARMKSFDSKMFCYCDAMLKVGMEEGAAAQYMIVNDMLVTKDRKLVYFPSAKPDCIITADITEIGAYAFYKANKIKTVSIPSHVTAIWEGAFKSCKTLTKVTFNGGYGARSVTVGVSAFTECTALSAVEYKNSPKITDIGENAFYKCTALTGFTIPDTVISVGDNAFADCSNLKAISIGAAVETLGNYAFKNCKGLTSVTLPASLTSLGEYAFGGCIGLRSVAYRSENGSPLSIGVMAFSSCSALTEFYVPKFVTELGDGVFTDSVNLAKVTVADENKNYTEYDDIVYKLDDKGNYIGIVYYPYTKSGAVVLPESMTSIGGGVFGGNKNITSVSIGKNVTFVGADAFKNCTNLRTVTFDETGTEPLTVGSGMFWGCSKLHTVNLPSRMTAVPDRFLQGTAVTSVVIPDKAVSIGQYAFSTCTGLVSVTFGTRESDGERICDLTTIKANAFYNCKNISEISIPYSVVDIGNSVFYGCAALKKVRFENDPVPSDELPLTMGTSIFYGCSELSDIVLPERLTAIPNNAFTSCVNLSSINLPGNLKNRSATVLAVGTSAFSGCTSLQNVTCTKNSDCESPFSIGKGAFSGCTALVGIELPKRSEPADASKPYSVFNELGVNYIMPKFDNFVRFVVEDGGIYSSDEQGILYYNSVVNGEIVKDHGTLIACPYGISGTVTVPATTHTVYDYSFSYSNIRELTFQEANGQLTEDEFAALPDLVISENAFYYSKLESVKFPSRLKSLGKNSFSNSSALVDITFESESRLTEIKDSAFYATAITLLRIPETVKTVGSSIVGRTPITELWIPSAVAGNMYTSFLNAASSLTSINIYGHSPEENEPNVLFGDDGKTLLWYDPGNTQTEYVIPEGVESIATRAFYGQNHLKTVKFADSSLKTIGAYAFSGSSVTTVDLPEDCQMTAVGSSAFNESNITSITIPNKVTSIGGSAFKACKELTSIAFTPQTVTSSDGQISSKYVITSIGASAFENCVQLNNVVLPDSVTSLENIVFGGCSALTDITFGKGLKKIGNKVFGSCESLVSITLPDSVTSLGINVFTGCINLVNVKLPSNISSIGNTMFNGCVKLTDVTFGDKITSMGTNVFQNCTSLRSVTLPDKITKLDNSVFSGCTALEEITVPDSVTAIGDTAFLNCTSLTAVTFGAGSKLATIGKEAFAGCSVLRSIEIPGSVIQIGKTSCNVFKDCVALESVTFRQGTVPLKFVGTTPFSGCTKLKTVDLGGRSTALPGSCFKDLPELTDVRGLDNVTEIGTYAFQNCTGLSAFTVPSSVTKIGLYAFNNCSGLLSLTFENSDTALTVPDGTAVSGVFVGCTSLVSVNFGGREISVGKYAFYNCAALAEILDTDGITKLGDYSMSGCGFVSVKVPGSLSVLGINVFENCRSLISVEIPTDAFDTLSACTFKGCDLLAEVNFTGGNTMLAAIGASAFENCMSLAAVDIPQCVSMLEDRAFYNCGFTELKVPVTVSDFGKEVYGGNAALVKVIVSTDDLVTLGVDMFVSSSVRSVEFTGSGVMLKGLSDGLFKDCANLSDIVIPSCVNTIGAYALKGTAIERLVLSEGLVSIENGAFENCVSLKSVNIPATVSNIGDNPFKGCTDLAEISVAQDNQLYVTDGSVLYDGTSTKLIGVLSSASGEIVLPETVTTVAAEAFARSSVTKVIMPSGVVSVLAGTFEGCENLTEVVLPEGIVSIEARAFAGCVNLNNVSIPSTVKYIGENAFDGCTALSDMRFATRVSDGNAVNDLTDIRDSAFAGCASLTAVSVPDGVTDIGEYAFSGCAALATVGIPESVLSLGTGVFENCGVLTALNFAENSKLDTLGDFPFRNSGLTEIVLPAGISTVNENMFAGATAIKKVTFAPGTAIIQINNSTSKTSAFGDTALESVDFSGRSANLSYYAFDGCVKLKSVTWNSVKTVEKNAFSGCTALTDISLPASVKTIGAYAFAETGLTSLTVPNNVSQISEYAFYKTPISGKLVIPGNVKTVQQHAFDGCTNLTGVEVQRGVQYLYGPAEASKAGWVFAGCTSLREVSLPDSLINGIPVGTFEGCTSLVSVEIPAVPSIYGQAFKGCTNLTDVTFRGTATLLYIYEECFMDCTSLSNINLPERSYVSLYARTFKNCTSLTEIALPSAVGYIYAGLFEGCTSLENVTVKGQITKISENAFKDCTKISSIVIKGKKLNTVETDAFAGWTSAQTIYITDSDGAVSADWAEGWHGNAAVVWNAGPDTPTPPEQIGKAAYENM